MDIQSLTCPVCHRDYNDLDFIPRLIPVCGHTICSACIKEVLSQMQKDDLFICPEDRTGMVVSDLDVELFPKNYTLIRQLGKKNKAAEPSERKKEPKFLSESTELTSKSETSSPRRTTVMAMPTPTAGTQTSATTTFRNSLNRFSLKAQETNTGSFNNGNCKEHNRKLELVCLDHKCRICEGCALFGQHKGHNYQPEEEIIKEIASRAETLIDLFENIEENQNKLLDHRIQDQISAKFYTRLNELTEQIHNTFADYINQLKSKEKKLVESIKRQIIDLEDEFKQSSKVPSALLDRIIRWKIEVQEKLASLSENTDYGELDFELVDNQHTSQNVDLTALGSQILQELNKFIEVPQRSLDSYIQGVCIAFTDDFQKAIENVCRITIPGLDNSKYRNSLGSTMQLPLGGKLQFDTRGSLGLNATNSNQHNNTPKFDEQQNRFSILSDDEDTINFDPNTLPNLELPDTEEKKLSKVSEITKNGTSYFNSHNPTKFVRESFGVGFETKSSPITKNKSISDLKIEIPDDTPKNKIGHSQSTKHLPTFSNYELGPSKLRVETPDSKKKLHLPFNVSMAKNEQRTSATSHNKSARDISAPSPTNQRSTLVSKNKSALDLSVSTVKGKKPGSGSFQKASPEEVSKSKNVTSSATSPKASITSKKLLFSVNPKFESVVNGLRNETLETVDFTAAELGDQGIAFLSDFLVGNKTVKTLKLLKNKITDEGAMTLARALADNYSIHTVNLTQNLLTERTVDAFLNLAKINQTIKYLYFNQNSMKIINVKTKIKELQKLGINASI